MIIHVVGAAIIHQGQVLIARRPQGTPHAGLWEFPGGKVEPGETPQDALCREVREELGLEVEVGRWVAQGGARTPSAASVVLDVYECCGQVPEGVTSSDHDQVKWVALSELESYCWPPADWPAVRALSQRAR